MQMSKDADADEKLADAIRTAIESAREAGNHVLVADLLSILRIVPVREHDRKLFGDVAQRSENCN
jgi:hypothetical protein